MAKHKEPVCRYCEQAETIDGLIGELEIEREIVKLQQQKIDILQKGIVRAQLVMIRNPAKAQEILSGLVKERN